MVRPSRPVRPLSLHQEDHSDLQSTPQSAVYNTVSTLSATRSTHSTILTGKSGEIVVRLWPWLTSLGLHIQYATVRGQVDVLYLFHQDNSFASDLVNAYLI